MKEQKVLATDYVSENAANTLKYRLGLMIDAVLSLPKSIVFCLRTLPLSQAVKLPILVSWKTIIYATQRDVICFNVPLQRFMVKFGFGGSVGIPGRKSGICLEGGKLVFGNHVTFTEGTALRCDGEMKFGNNFFCNKNCTFGRVKR